MKRPTRKMQITVYDWYTLSPNEKRVYHAVFEETILNNIRCAKLSLKDLSELTGIKKTTVASQLEKLKRRRLIEIDKTQKTNKICIITTYIELLRSAQ